MKAMTNTMTTPSPTKIKIAAKLIIIDQVEGPTGSLRKTEHTTWADAEERLQRICWSAPKDGSYWKTDFRIEFVGGELYSGRYDAAHPESKSYEGALAKHIRDHLELYAGLRRPAHIPEADYDAMLARRESDPAATEKRADYLAFLMQYALEDLPMPVSTVTAWRVIVGNTFPVKGLLTMLGGKWDPNAKQWSVPAEKHAEAQAAVDRFNPPPKPAPTLTDTRRAAFAATPPQAAPKPAPAAAKPKARKGPKLPPTALERRLEALLTGAKAIHDSIPAGDAIRPQLDFAIGHIQEALDRLSKGA